MLRRAEGPWIGAIIWATKVRLSLVKRPVDDRVESGPGRIAAITGHICDDSFADAL